MNTGTLTHGTVIDGSEVSTGSIVHGTGCIVHRACQHTQEWSTDVITGKIVKRLTVDDRFPFGIFQSFDTFKIKNIGISALYTARLDTVIVKYRGCRLLSVPIRTWSG